MDAILGGAGSDRALARGRGPVPVGAGSDRALARGPGPVLGGPGSDGACGRSVRRRGFSLAELMIALVVLGLGLLFIAAALPVGVEYARRNLDMAVGETAGQHALELLEMQVRTSAALGVYALIHSPPPAPPPPQPARLDSIHRPRAVPTPPPTAPHNFYTAPTVVNDYEPIIKVRPFALANITMGSPQGLETGVAVLDPVEAMLFQYGQLPIPPNPATPFVEWDVFPSNVNFYPAPADMSPNGHRLSLSQYPVFAPVARVYPPIEPFTTYRAQTFFQGTQGGPDYPRYEPRQSLSLEDLRRERQAVVDRRIVWTAFYRRVSYAQQSDPLTYELIVVVCRRTSANHRFPLQDVRDNRIATFRAPQAVRPGDQAHRDIPADFTGADRLAPTPWLVTFESLPTPALVKGQDYKEIVTVQGGQTSVPPTRQRFLVPSFVQRPKLEFKCTRELGVLLPVGAVLIPARNDMSPTELVTPGPWPQPPPAFDRIGFVPSAPDALPIYEVIERPDDTTVVVAGNGYYPWWDPSINAAAADQFPFWIIPPSFVSRAGSADRQPVYERSSPVVAVVRKVVRLHEIPAQ